jgi:hypothetical protein
MRQQLAQPDALPFRATLDGQIVAFNTAEEKFNALADAWLNAQGGRSRLDFSHEAYLQIMSMGPAVIPSLLHELESESGHWFRALRAIVGYSPVPAEARQDFRAASRAWLQWGQEHGYAASKSEGHLDANIPSGIESGDSGQ